MFTFRNRRSGLLGHLRLGLLALTLLALLPDTPLLAAPPAFQGGGELSSDAGYVLLAWKSDGPVTVSIGQREDRSDAKSLYAGTAESYFLSGLRDGEYYLWLENEKGESAEPAKLTVVHQSLERALWLTVIGLAIFLSIVAAILRGARDD